MSVITDSSSIDVSLTNIWQAWTAFRKGKKPSREILIFQADLERNLLLLCSDLNTGKYQHGTYNHRIVNEKKRRDIAVASVRDRVVHRLFYDYLMPLVDSKLDYDVWSCRPGKGLHAALRRTHDLLSKYDHAYVWRADISKFFDNVDQKILQRHLYRLIYDQVAQDLVDKIIFSYGHKIHPLSPTAIDTTMSKKIRANINTINIASYRSMHLPVRQSKSIPWLLLEECV